MPSGRVISVDVLTIGARSTLRVIGTRPLIVASWSTIEVNGVVDASSSAITIGAGGNPVECAGHAATAGAKDPTGASGGGGGSFGGSGESAGGRGGGGATLAGGNGQANNTHGGGGGGGGTGLIVLATTTVNIPVGVVVSPTSVTP